MSARAPAADDIVLVDDAPDNLQLLVALLVPLGYRVRPFTSGESAVRAVRSRVPDLILLDVSMPGWDGYEVCRRLKADERTREIPVVFLSALDDAQGKVKAFESGGVDYVTKPFQPEEVVARVAMHLELARNRRALAESYRSLRSLEQARDAFADMVAHDLRVPLWSVEVALAGVESALGRREPAARRTLLQARNEIQSALELVSSLLELSRLEQRTLPLKHEHFDGTELAQTVLNQLGGVAGERRLSVSGEKALRLWGDPALIRRTLQNLVGNALKFTGPRGRIDITLSLEPSGTRIQISDDGVGLDEAQQAALFSGALSTRRTSGGRGYGIGLAFVQAAIEAHGGSLGVTSRVGQGSTFWFILPPAPSDKS